MKKLNIFFHIGQLCDNHRGASFAATVAQAAVILALTASMRFHKARLMDVMLDMGAAKGSNENNEQYLAYRSEIGRQYNIDEQRGTQ